MGDLIQFRTKSNHQMSDQQKYANVSYLQALLKVWHDIIDFYDMLPDEEKAKVDHIEREIDKCFQFQDGMVL